jgi:hypothetical protein
MNNTNKIADIIVNEVKRILETHEFGNFICNTLQDVLYDNDITHEAYYTVKRIHKLYCETQKISEYAYAFGGAGEWNSLREHFCQWIINNVHNVCEGVIND